MLKPDLAIVDVSLGDANGIELVKLMKAEVPQLPILVLSVHEESLYALRALKAGASGYLMKAEAVRSLDSGSASPIDQLSDREFEVLELLGRRHDTKSVARLLNLSVKTIETHRAHIKEKLGFKEANDMIRFAIDWVAQREA